MPSLYYIQTPTSLSRAFVNFLESESSPKDSKEPQTSIPVASSSSHSVPGYIDPLTDPDRPSLSTVALLGPLPGKGVQSSNPQSCQEDVWLPSASGDEQNKEKALSGVTNTSKQADTSLTHSSHANSFQSSLLRNILADP